MTVTRRQLIARSAALLVAAALPGRVLAANSPARSALAGSQLIYLTPMRSDGSESDCHGEVWFVYLDDEIYVSTQTGAWRAQALRQGLQRTRIWIGEFGPWKRAERRYRSAPFLELDGRLEVDRAVHERVLTRFGQKYTAEWSSWGPRFQTGLADGSRVLLRYSIVD